MFTSFLYPFPQTLFIRLRRLKQKISHGYEIIHNYFKVLKRSLKQNFTLELLSTWRMGVEVQLEETWRRFQGKNTTCFRKFSENDPAEPFLKKYAGVRPVLLLQKWLLRLWLIPEVFRIVIFQKTTGWLHVL